MKPPEQLSTLAEIVSHEQLISEARLHAALRQARTSGQALIAVLVESEGLDDDALAATLARHLRLPLTSLSGDIDAEALREVAFDVARARRVLPIGLDDDTGGSRVLRLVMADPTDVDTVGEVEAASGCRVEPMLACLHDLDAAIARVYRSFVTAIMRDREGEPASEAPRKRVPFGGDLGVATPSTIEAAEDATDDPPALHTQPFHNLVDEAPLELRHRALLDLLIARGVITIDDYLRELRRLLGDR